MARRLKRIEYGNRGRIVQFHPGTTYESFVGGLAPQDGGAMGFTFRSCAGNLIAALLEARASPDKRFLLVIDEISMVTTTTRTNSPRPPYARCWRKTLLKDTSLDLPTRSEPREQRNILLVSASVWRAGSRARSHRRRENVVKTQGDLSGHPAHAMSGYARF
jgi:hypothetical protein